MKGVCGMCEQPSYDLRPGKPPYFCICYEVEGGTVTRRGRGWWQACLGKGPRGQTGLPDADEANRCVGFARTRKEAVELIRVRVLLGRAGPAPVPVGRSAHVAPCRNGMLP